MNKEEEKEFDEKFIEDSGDFSVKVSAPRIKMWCATIKTNAIKRDRENLKLEVHYAIKDEETLERVLNILSLNPNK